MVSTAITADFTANSITSLTAVTHVLRQALIENNVSIEHCPVLPGSTTKQCCYDVIDGKWGNGQDRINRLRAAGYDPYAIQSIVNYLLKQPQRYNIPNYRDPYLG